MDAIIGKMEIRDKKEEDICNFENKIQIENSKVMRKRLVQLAAIIHLKHLVK
jgi:hypothetical protein